MLTEWFKHVKTTKGTNNYGTELRNHITEFVSENEAITHLSMKIVWLMS